MGTVERLASIHPSLKCIVDSNWKSSMGATALSQVPLDRILLETDSPYLTPVPHRGKRNEPIYVRYVAEEISRIKGITTEQVASLTTENARLSFGL